jgi:hypothetical protein
MAGAGVASAASGAGVLVGKGVGVGGGGSGVGVGIMGIGVGVGKTDAGGASVAGGAVSLGSPPQAASSNASANKMIHGFFMMSTPSIIGTLQICPSFQALLLSFTLTFCFHVRNVDFAQLRAWSDTPTE